jgi:hypothetical protein
VSARPVVDAEEDDVARLIATKWSVGSDTAGDDWFVCWCIAGWQEAVRRPLGRGREPDVDPGLRHRPAHEHRAVAGRPRGLTILHVLHAAAAVGRRAQVVGEASDVRDSPAQHRLRATRPGGRERRAVLGRLREHCVDVPLCFPNATNAWNWWPSKTKLSVLAAPKPSTVWGGGSRSGRGSGGSTRCACP